MIGLLLIQRTAVASATRGSRGPPEEAAECRAAGTIRAVGDDSGPGAECRTAVSRRMERINMTSTTRLLDRLTPQEVEQYHALGYVKGFPVFSPQEVARLQQEYANLCRLLPPGTNMSRVNW